MDDFPQQDTQITALHNTRHDRIYRLVKQLGVKQVLDLGCGSGTFLLRLLADKQFEQVVGVEHSGLSLMQARSKLANYLDEASPRVRLINASYIDLQPTLVNYELAVMIETIEHVDPQQLSRVEQAVFGYLRPKQLILSTPNAEYNVLYGLSAGQFRDPDHQFEWPRQKFQQWARGVALRHGYQVRFEGIGEADAEFGCPTQMALFQLQSTSA